MACCLELKDALGVDVVEQPVLQHEASLRTVPDAANSRNRVAISTFIDVRDYPYNARVGTIGDTATTTSGSASVSVLTGSQWLVRDGVCILGAGADHGFTAPAAPTTAVTGNAGSTQLDYKIIAISDSLGWTLPSSNVTVTSAPDILASGSLLPDLDAVSVVATTNINISDLTKVVATIDGLLVRPGAFVLLAGQTNQVENGRYSVSTVTGSVLTMARSGTINLYSGYIIQRGAHAGWVFRCTAFPGGVVGTNPQTWESAPYVDVFPRYFLAAVATTANITLSGLQTIDGYLTIAGDTVLVKNQTAPAGNGLYVAASGSWSRLTTYDSAAEILPGTIVQVANGTPMASWCPNTKSGAMYVQTATVVTVGTDPITFAQQDIKYFAAYVRRGGSGNYNYLGACNANPYWQSPTTPISCYVRDFGAKATLNGSGNGMTVAGYLPSTAPSSAQKNWFKARIASIASNTLTLDATVTSTVSGAAVRLDNAMAFEDAHNAASASGQSQGIEIYFPPGTLQHYGLWKVRKSCRYTGAGGSKGTTIVQFSDGGGLVVQGATQSVEGSSASYAIFEHLNFVVEHESLAMGGGLFSCPETDPLPHRALVQGSMVHITTLCTFRQCNAFSYGTSWVLNGLDTAAANCNDTLLDHCYAPGTDNGHGFYLTGANANICGLDHCSAENIDGDGIVDQSFLGSNVMAPHFEIAYGYLYRGVSGTVTNAYCESGFGVIHSVGGFFDAMFLDIGQLDEATATAGNWSIGTQRAGETFGKATGTVTVEVANYDDGTEAIVRKVASSGYETHEKASHFESILRGSFPNALTRYYVDANYDSSILVASRWMGSNPTGSGIERFPRGVELTAFGETLPRRFRGTAGVPSNHGWYQNGDFFLDMQTGVVGGSFSVIGWGVLSEFGIGTARVNGSTHYVGDVITFGSPVVNAFVVQSIADNAKTGVLGGSAPAAPGAGLPVLDGACTLYQLVSSTPAFHAISHPSPPLTVEVSPFSATGNPAASGNGVGKPWRRFSSAPYSDAAGVPGTPSISGTNHVLLNDIIYAVTATNAQSGNRLRLTRDNNTGDFKITVQDNTLGATGLIAVLPPGTAAGVEYQFDGNAWVLVGGYGIDTRYRREKSRTDIKAIVPLNRAQGNIVYCEEDRSLWQFDTASTSSDAFTPEALVLTPADAPANGRWLRIDKDIELKIAVTFAKTDGQVLYTVPTGFNLFVTSALLEVTANWTGGTASAVGVSSDTTRLSTKGDILGGAAGDVAAELTTTNKWCGTTGTQVGKPRAVIPAGKVIRWDRITSAFTAGTGNLHVRLAQVS